MDTSIKYTYHFKIFCVISSFNRAYPFRRVCPFHFYGICNQYRLFSDGDIGKVSVTLMMSKAAQGFSFEAY